MIRRISVEYPSKQQFLSVIGQLGDFIDKDYWHKNGSIEGNLNRCVGASQSMAQARRIEKAIGAVKLTGTGKSSTR
jgi:hypothetical protein